MGVLEGEIAKMEPTCAALSSDEGQSRLSVRNMSKTFSGQLALNHVDLDIRSGEVHALVGENGSGKSTFIKILAGYYDPDEGGSILVDGAEMSLGSSSSARSAGLRFVHQDLALSNSLSVATNLALGTDFGCRLGTIRSRYEFDRAKRDLERVGLAIDPRTPVGLLSAAERTGVAVARALRHEPDAVAKVLVLDEPTANLPSAEVDRLLDILRVAAAGGVAVLYVSHRLDEIFLLANRVTVLRDGHKVTTRDVSELTRAQLISLLVGTEFEEVREATESIQAEAQTRVRALEVQALSSATLDELSFVVHQGEILGLAGITGSGRETVLGTAFGALPRVSGTVLVGARELPRNRPDRSVADGIAFIPADRKVQGAFLGLSARDNITLNSLGRFWGRWRLKRGAERSEAASWFKQLSIRPIAGTDKAFSTFSGGNQQKIVFAKWLATKPSVLLVDEPTQGVDVGAKAELYAIIQHAVSEGAAVVVTSSDTDELVALCQRVLVLREGRIVSDLTGERLSVANLSKAILGADLKGDRL